MAEDGTSSLHDTPEASSLEWKQSGHDFKNTEEGAECVRCNLACAQPRVIKASKAKCPAWALMDPQRNEVVAARPWAKWAAMLPTTWRQTYGGKVKLDAARRRDPQSDVVLLRSSHPPAAL